MKAACRFGVVKEVWVTDDKVCKVYLIHSPAFTETAIERQKHYQKHCEEEYGCKIIIIRLNTGVEEEAERAAELLELCS